MSMTQVYVFGAALVLVVLALWWLRRMRHRHVDRSQKVRLSAERERADDLRDCLVAHQSMVPDRTAGAADDTSGDPENPDAQLSPEQRKREERWRRAQSALDPELPADPESRR